MNSKVEQPGSSASGGDIVKYVLALALVAAGVFAFYWFADWATVLRALAVCGGLVAGAVVFLTTAKGAQVREFLSESRFELRKVVWPTKVETRQTTIAVIIFVVIMGVFFWSLDLFLLWVTRALTGQGS